jgi:hypothetical protein
MIELATVLRDTIKGTLCAKGKITTTQLEGVAEMRDVTLCEISMISEKLSKIE